MLNKLMEETGLTMSELNDANIGICTECYATGCAEPDAVGYECPECGKPTLMGIMEILMDAV